MDNNINFEIFQTKENLFDIKTTHINYKLYNYENVTIRELYAVMVAITEILNNKHN